MRQDRVEDKYLILKKYVTLSTISFYNMNALGIGQMILYLAIFMPKYTVNSMKFKKAVPTALA